MAIAPCHSAGCSYCLCSCSGIGGPGDIHNWGYGVRNEPMSLHHMDPDGWSLMSYSRQFKAGKKEDLSGKWMARNSKGSWNFESEAI